MLIAHYITYTAQETKSTTGMLELPYLSEERLEKLGIPLGPRIRILQVSRQVKVLTHDKVIVVA